MFQVLTKITTLQPEIHSHLLDLLLPWLYDTLSVFCIILHFPQSPYFQLC